MSTTKITGAKEFVSTRGERGGIDEQITDWVNANPDATIVDVKYRVVVYQDDGKNKMAKMALVLFNNEAGSATSSVSSRTASASAESKQDDPKTGARTMVMNLRKDLYDEADEAEE